MANRIEKDGTQDPWLSGQIGLLPLGIFMFFFLVLEYDMDARNTALHIFSSMAGAGSVGPRLRWRDEGPVTLCWEMGCLTV